jgi:acyl-CoA thioester hydrolase
MPRRSWPLPPFVSAAEPAYVHVSQQTVAFRDCDPMGILWHGNYWAYLERARHEMTTALGISVPAMLARGIQAPVVHQQLWHHAPAHPGEAITVTVRAYASEQPRLYCRYRVEADGRLLAEAEAQQVLSDGEGRLLLQQPPELAALLRGQLDSDQKS